ncbi:MULTISPECIES: Crp/Fnr family transcriptional regulator [Brevibacillus]|jgi:CRP/FNR family transcriptional regulator|uniref:Crp/Fnr family transcriptional regulator n=1 Tax=Brevibacillus aydinogluensis TaxID=927786 RepID=A0AA48MCH0_9BACL|nr:MULTISPECIES: Crp/Fnr family transcriptional regulator [Bacillales]REK61163.1 MAG: Crp/Fnr family transcriptional regulator [Brevibacillus sp.]MBR8661067.1 Crp/Fnr family transcriptional regulator [Brevibacillus sp. NL20B1]MDT3417531.1 CRP/FNR family transcriptional regulator [Brevibacillus aydinogluensis]UFJ62901.1 Crp/Fnr family transcriptional regulator [Anoxybacillus sediminis]CAJ1003945.1 Crp/Fnr family transcriptional regulator [Brevibacillus aydinogluensis]
MQKQVMSAFLRQVPMFHDLSDQEMERVAEIAISRFIPKKSVIFSEGSEKEAVYFIQEGLVKTFKTDENGHEQIVSLLKPVDMFPHTGFFNQNPYPATAEAIIDTHLVAIPVRLFERLMLNTPSIAVKMMRVMGDKIVELQEKLQSLSGQHVKHRVLSFLLKLAEQHGEVNGNSITINLPMTHQEIASSIGTTRESVNRLLNQFSKESLLKFERNRIVIMDLEALKRQKELK